MRQYNGTPIYYLWEVTSLAGSGTTAQTITFNDPGILRQLSFKAVDSSGAEISANGFTLNITRQNARGLTTGNVIASAITTNSTGGPMITLPPLVGDYPLRRNDTLNVTVENLTSTTAARVQLIFLLHADINE